MGLIALCIIASMGVGQWGLVLPATEGQILAWADMLPVRSKPQHNCRTPSIVSLQSRNHVRVGPRGDARFKPLSVVDAGEQYSHTLLNLSSTSSSHRSLVYIQSCPGL